MAENIHFKSGNGEWGTPQDLFDNLNDIFQFDLDAAATAENTLCEKWLGPGSDIVEDAFDTEWSGTIYCNPPYGRKIGRWIDKAYEASEKNGATVVMLLPARTETKWFDTCWRAAFICFIHGRLRFSGSESPAPFPSCLVVFSKDLPSELDISMLSGEGTVIRSMWLYNPIDKMRYEWLREARERREQNETQETRRTGWVPGSRRAT